MFPVWVVVVGSFPKGFKHGVLVFHYIVVNLLSPVKVEKKFISVLNTKDGKSFKKGYVIETKKLRLKESVLGSCYTIVAVGTYLIIALNNSGGIG